MEKELENEIKKKEEELQKLEERKVIPKKVVKSEEVETEEVEDKESEDEEELETQEEPLLPKVLEETEEKTIVDAVVNHEERLKNIEATLYRLQ